MVRTAVVASGLAAAMAGKAAVGVKVSMAVTVAAEGVRSEAWAAMARVGKSFP